MRETSPDIPFFSKEKVKNDKNKENPRNHYKTKAIAIAFRIEFNLEKKSRWVDTPGLHSFMGL